MRTFGREVRIVASKCTKVRRFEGKSPAIGDSMGGCRYRTDRYLRAGRTMPVRPGALLPFDRMTTPVEASSPSRMSAFAHCHGSTRSRRVYERSDPSPTRQQVRVIPTRNDRHPRNGRHTSSMADGIRESRHSTRSLPDVVRVRARRISGRPSLRLADFHRLEPTEAHRARAPVVARAHLSDSLAAAVRDVRTVILSIPSVPRARPNRTTRHSAVAPTASSAEGDPFQGVQGSATFTVTTARGETTKSPETSSPELDCAVHR